MAVTFSNPQSHNVTVAATTNSFAFDATGADYVAIHIATTSTTFSTGATYNGSAMTKSTGDNTSFTSEMYYIANPTTGSNTITVTWAGNQQSLVSAICVTGADKSSIGVAGSSTGGTTTTPQVTMTTVGAHSGICVGLSTNRATGVTDIGSQSRQTSNTAVGIFAEYTSTVTEASPDPSVWSYQCSPDPPSRSRLWSGCL